MLSHLQNLMLERLWCLLWYQHQVKDLPNFKLWRGATLKEFWMHWSSCQSENTKEKVLRGPSVNLQMHYRPIWGGKYKRKYNRNTSANTRESCAQTFGWLANTHEANIHKIENGDALVLPQPLKVSLNFQFMSDFGFYLCQMLIFSVIIFILLTLDSICAISTPIVTTFHHQQRSRDCKRRRFWRYCQLCGNIANAAPFDPSSSQSYHCSPLLPPSTTPHPGPHFHQQTDVLH